MKIMFVILKLIEYYPPRNRNALYLLQKPYLKNETVMKKSESTYILSSQNHIKQEMINYFAKKNFQSREF